jgi:ATP-dependent Clp protease ATP-binding subunit ClpA
LNHQHIGTQHLLLGLLRQEGSLAARILQDHGLRLPQVREEIARSSHSEEGRTGFGFYRPRRDAGFGPDAAGTPGVRFEGRRFAGPRFAGPRGAGHRFAGQWTVALEDAGRVAQMARHVAAERRSPCIETTDLLLALTHEKEVAERFLGPVEPIRKHPGLERVPRERVSEAELAFSEDCRLVFNFAIEEAAQLGQRTGPGHLLLGILRAESCAAAEILRECGFTEAGIRTRLGPPPPSSDPEQGRNYV